MALGDSIFNLPLLDTIEKAETQEGLPGELHAKKPDAEIDSPAEVSFMLQPEGTLRVWEKPSRRYSYAIGVDIASGVSQTGTDASCAYVCKVTPNILTGKPNLEMVAALHCRLDTFSYAAAVKKLGMWYNEALIIPEVNSIGAAFLTDLKRHMNYANIFTEETPAEYLEDGGLEPKMGVTATESSKPAMVTALSWYLNNRQMIVRDAAFLRECRTFQRTVKGNTVKYGAAPGAHDDRVTSLALVCYACSLFWDQVDASLTEPESEPDGPPPPRKNFDPFGLKKSKKGGFKL
jgi:hypothetical protein